MTFKNAHTKNNIQRAPNLYTLAGLYKHVCLLQEQITRANRFEPIAF